MKKLILTFGILTAGIFFVNAQNKTEAKTTKIVNTLTKVCGLTPDQVAKLQPLAEDFIKVREANKKQYGNDPDELKTANKTNNKNYKAKIIAMLTPDQQQKFNDYLAQKKANRKTTNGPPTDNDHQ